MNPTRRYTQAQSTTASPERLMVLLFEAALRHMRTGASALDVGRQADANRALAQASDIVTELASTFDAARHPALGAQLKQVYGFVLERLLLANARRDAVLAREAERVFAPVADGFTRAVQQLQSERAGGATP
jgi:flagellar secretion chaperone FliS